MFPSFHAIRRAGSARRTIPLIAISVFISVNSPALFAGQHTYTVGVNADITGGGNTPNLPGTTIQNTDAVPFLATYPSVSFKARSQHSSLDSNYGFGYDRNFSDPAYETRSHSASLGYSRQLGPKWQLNISDVFSMTSDISTYRLLSGTPVDQDQFQYSFTPVFAQSNQSNTATVALGRKFNEKSSLNLTGSFSSLDYPANPQTVGIVSDQKRISATVAYKYSGEHYSWRFGYSGARFNFSAFQNSLNHSGFIGYTYQISRALSFSVDVGPSYLGSLEGISNPVGTNITGAIRRTERNNSFGLTVSHTGGESSGLGAVSRNQTAALDLNHKLGKNTSLSVNVSAFDTKGLQANALSARGGAAGGSVGYVLSRYWSLNLGGQYQHYEGYNTGGYDQKRLFASLRYSNSELWRF